MLLAIIFKKYRTSRLYPEALSPEYVFDELLKVTESLEMAKIILEDRVHQLELKVDYLYNQDRIRKEVREAEKRTGFICKLDGE